MAQTLLRYYKTTIRINETRLNLVQPDSGIAAGDSHVRSKNKSTVDSVTDWPVNVTVSSTVGNETDSPVKITVSSKEDLQYQEDKTGSSHLKRRIAI